MIPLVYAGAHLLGFLIVIVAYHHWPKTQTTIQAYRPKTSGPFDKCHVDYAYSAPEPVITVNMAYASASVFLLSACFEIFYATDGFGFGTYSEALIQGWNPYKFICNSLTSAIIFVLVALVSNTRDVGTLLTLALTSMGLQFLAFSNESLLRGKGLVSRNARDTLTSNSIVWWILFLALWTPIVYNLVALKDDAHVMGYQWYILIMQFLYFASFGVIQLFQMRSRLSGNSKYNFASTEGQWQTLGLFQNISITSAIIWALMYDPRNC
jgi:hypothetical protein